MPQTFAERLGWIPKSENLRMSMGRALTYAQERGHAEVTLEHFLLALIDDPNASAVFEACNIDLNKLRSDLSTHISTQMEHLIALGEGMAQPSEGFKKVMAHASAAAEQSHREQIDGAIVLAALIGEAQSRAAQILKSYGLTFDVAVNSLKNANASSRGRPASHESHSRQNAGDQHGHNMQARHHHFEEPGHSRDHGPDHNDQPHHIHSRSPMQANPYQGAQHWSPPPSARRPDHDTGDMAADADLGYQGGTSAPESIFNQKYYSEPEPDNQDRLSDMPGNSGFEGPEEPAVKADAGAGGFLNEQHGEHTEEKEELNRISSEATVEDILASVREIIGVNDQKPEPAREEQPVRMPDRVMQPSSMSLPQRLKQSSLEPDEVQTGNKTDNFEQNENNEKDKASQNGAGDAIPEKSDKTDHEAVSENRQSPVRDRGNPEPQVRDKPFAARTADRVSDKPVPPGARIQQPADNRRPAAPVQESEAQRQPANRQMPPPAPGGFDRPPQRPQQHPQHPPQNKQHPQHPQGSAQGPQGMQPPRQPQGRGGLPPHPAGQPHPQDMKQQRRVPQTEAMPPLQRPRPQEVTRGQLIENIPRVMRVSKPVQVEVRVGRDDVRDMERGLLGGAPPNIHEVAVTEAMSVRLYAPEGGFIIEPGSPETQWIDNRLAAHGDNYASWIWRVTPTNRGKRPLHLGISARIVGDKGVLAHSLLPEQSVRVSVRINYFKTIKWFIGWGFVAVASGALGKYGEKIMDFIQYGQM